MKASNCYDYYFMDYAMEFFGVTQPWEWFKAQAIAESNLDPAAKSPASAIGVMQLMPDTAAEMARQLRIDNNPLVPHLNIRMGIGYAFRCWSIFTAEHGIERLRFMFGAYNAGPGNIIEAQKLAEKHNLPTDSWESISAMLPSVTGSHAVETTSYVARIERYYHELRGDA